MSDLPGKKKKNMNSGNIESTFLPGNIQLELGKRFYMACFTHLHGPVRYLSLSFWFIPSLLFLPLLSLNGFHSLWMTQIIPWIQVS